MSKVVYKYPLQMADVQNIAMPAGAKPLSVQVQKGVPCLWALVDPLNESTVREVRIAGTGHQLPDSVHADEFVSTFQLHNGTFVFHVFVS